MRRILPYACALLAMSVVAACDDAIVLNVDGRHVDGSGTIVTEARDVPGFERITLAGEGRVIVTEAEASSLTIETDDNLLAHIDTTVRSRTLEIATESGVDIDPTGSVIYRVATPEVTRLTLTGAGRFELGECETEAFSVVLSGAGSIEVEQLVADELDVEITGAGDVRLVGTVGSQRVSIPGAGTYDGRNLQSGLATVTTSGAGSATVWATDQLNATVTGIGSIDYWGSPQLTESITGLGTVNARGDA